MLQNNYFSFNLISKALPNITRDHVTFKLTQFNLSFTFHYLDDVAGMVVLVLNTLYFKGSWRHQFAPNATKNGQFFVSPKIQKTIPFMNVNDKFYYVESAKYDAKILRLPYLVSTGTLYRHLKGHGRFSCFRLGRDVRSLTWLMFKGMAMYVKGNLDQQFFW